jgi:hypothetical protein
MEIPALQQILNPKKRQWHSAALSLSIACAGGCAADAKDSHEHVASSQSALGRVLKDDICEGASAAHGWSNAFLPVANEAATLHFYATPSGDASGSSAIDAVIGFSNGPATRFSDLGPIVRFNPDGFVDARNGDHYEGGYPYVLGKSLEFQVGIDLLQHRYEVWARPADDPAQPLASVASGFAFRAEQSQVPFLDNLASFVDSASGALQTCQLWYAVPGNGALSHLGEWKHTAFASRGGQYRVTFDTMPATNDPSGRMDAVIGLAQGVPNTFSSLAAIVRFNPQGTIDVRNGPSYAADTVVHYTNLQNYYFVMDIDAEQGRYSVSVRGEDPAAPYTVIAHDYRFRTEQASTTSFDHLGQYVDETEGNLYVSSVTIVY